MNKLILIGGASVAVAQYPPQPYGAYGYGFPGHMVRAAPRPQMYQAPHPQQHVQHAQHVQQAPQRVQVQHVPQQHVQHAQHGQYAPQRVQHAPQYAPQRVQVQHAPQQDVASPEPYLNFDDILADKLSDKISDKWEDRHGATASEYLPNNADPDIYLLSKLTNDDSEDVKQEKALDYALITNGLGKGIGWGGETNHGEIWSGVAAGTTKDYFVDQISGDPTDDFAGDILGDIEEELLMSSFQGDDLTKYLIKEKLIGDDSGSSDDDDSITKYLKFSMLAGGADPLTVLTILDDEDSDEDRKDKFLKYAMLGGGNALFSNPLLLWSMLSDESESQDDDELMTYLLLSQPGF